MKADLVRNTADPKAEAYVRGEVEHNGRVLDVTRNFRPTKARPNTVVASEGVTISDTNKAQEEIDAALGIDKAMLDLYVFKQQHTVYDFLTTTPAERARAYQVLCRTEACEALWDMLGTFLNKDREANAEVVDDSDALTQVVAELTTQWDDLAARRVDLAADVCDAAAWAGYHETVRDADRADTLVKQVQVCVERCKTLRNTVETATADLAGDTESHAAGVAKVTAGAAEADRIAAALKEIERHARVATKRADLTTRAAGLRAKAAVRVAPIPPADRAGLPALQAEVRDLTRGLAEARATLAVFGKTGLATCPTCRTPVSDLKPHLAACKLVVSTAPQEIKTAGERVMEIEAYFSADAAYQAGMADTAAKVAVCEAELSGLTDLDAPDGDAADLTQRLTTFRAAERATKVAGDDLVKRMQALAALNGQLDGERTRLVDLRGQAKAAKVEPDELATARQSLEAHATAVQSIAGVDGEMKGLAREITGKKDELKRLKARLVRSKKVWAMARVISNARDVLHRDRLPHRVARINLARMEGDVNENLARFDDPFWVETDASLGFVAHKPGEPPQAAARLSTGQRVILALAFWPAVASLWGGDLGMLALDEPTANLDGENRRLLAHAISEMTAKVRGDRQLIMVTHDPDLRTAFDQVVDLGS